MKTSRPGRYVPPRGRSSSPRTTYDHPGRRLPEGGDHVDSALEQWSREMPGLETKGADVLNRARRLVLESRPAIEQNFKRHGLDSGEFDVLATLRRSGPPYALRPTELFIALKVSSGGMTARLDRLERMGFIRRVPAEDDARSTMVELTPAGRKKIDAAFRDDMELENEMLSGLSNSEHEELVRLLRKATQMLKDASEEYREATRRLK